MQFEGGCLCGLNRFALSAPPTTVLNCHCSICRRAHGAAFGTFAVVARQDFRWLTGPLHLGTYASSPTFQRQFCRNCGSQLVVFEDWNPDGVTVVFAALDDPREWRPAGHLFAASKAAWHEIADPLPRFPGWPPGVGPPAAE